MNSRKRIHWPAGPSASGNSTFQNGAGGGQAGLFQGRRVSPIATTGAQNEFPADLFSDCREFR
jgi:hypothetical protein